MLNPLLPKFTLLTLDNYSLAATWEQTESQLVAQVMQTQQAYALVHLGEHQGVVVPRSYVHKYSATWQQAQASFAAQGLEIHTRLSGGGVVPQTPEIINIHLAYIVETPEPFLVAQDHYEALCTLLADFLAQYNIEASWQTVEGSFCDGRFNLSVNGQKIVGTAQNWQRAGDKALVGDKYVVLSHALLLVGDSKYLTELTNKFERAVGTDTIYLATKTTTVNECEQGVSAAQVYSDFLNYLQRTYCA
ncbi:lipoyl protein ligase domain-containing protein [Psittacicella hinzii]|uniref:BPL/LPL catalytic domain-containing protein n=1 Tax=Psittacicella hinzii TaxID=2028575 RepID=A0A3A1YU72_9GAMM|nr:lipoate--protein ligase family protein [Psittacicella hinzii]RIY40809.1 hypothetical protein CKF58_00070 [Psittacicella hinzii]